MLQPIVYLTCEIKGRDFKSRLLIAAHLVRMGYAAVVGQYWNMTANAAYAPKGVYHFKTANSIQADNMRHCKKHGHAVVATDEEAFCHAESVAAHTTHPATFDACDIYLALNESHARAVRKDFPRHATRILTVGTPRADLIRAMKYARPHAKPYALVNTSFGWTNSMWGGVEWVAESYFAASALDPDKREHREFVQSRVVYERRALSEMRAVLDWLVASSGLEVIVRPHPSETPGFWERPGVTVVAKSDPFPWLQHASVMIHNDSTTGLEAALMGAPALNLSPVDVWAKTQNIRLFNETVRTAEEAIEAIRQGRTRRAGNASDLSPHDAGRASAERIASLLPAPRPLPVPPWGVTPRTEIQIEKFSVSPEECLAAAQEVFPLAGAVPRTTQLADSVFLFQPA